MSTLPQNFFNHDAQAGGFFPLAHVGIEIESIGNRQNTLIEGIRGTGKTHILKMLKRYHLSSFAKSRILPVYVSLAEISEHSKKDPDEFRVQLYARIVSTAIETLEANKHHLSPNRGVVTGAVRLMLRGLGLDGYFGVENLDKSIDQVKTIADELLFKLSYDITAADLKNFRSSSSGLKNAGVASTDLKMSSQGVGSLGASVSLSSEESLSNTHTDEESVRLLGSRLSHRNASQFMINFLQQVQIILDLEHTLILLDECSEAGREAQVEIFRFFKAIRGSTSKLSDKEHCAFFVGSVYPRSETYYPSREVDGFSFEPGQDCGVEFVQWDEAEPESYMKFFEQMLIARARAVFGFEGTIANFISRFYDGRKTFNHIAICAGGTPRRFWEIHKRSYDSGTNKVSFPRAKIAIQEIVNEQTLGHTSLTTNDHAIVQHVIKVLTLKNEEARAKSKTSKNKVPQGIYFSATQQNSAHFGRLIMQGAIFDKSRMKSRRHSLRPHPIFALDTAIAYSNRVIPEVNFDIVAEQDFPKLTEDGFAHAASFEPPSRQGDKSWTIESVFKAYSSSPPTSSLKKLSPVIERGFIKAIRPNGNAFVTVLDGGSDAFVSKAEMAKLIAGGATKGAEVTFTISKNNLGRQASNLRLVEKGPTDDRAKLLQDVAQFIKNAVRVEAEIPLARLALDIKNHFGDEIGEQGWIGHKKFSGLVSSLPLEGVKLELDSSPGFIRRID
ncbi:hypothetical protein [Paragemmobacter straminiformis]|uniref:Uncharacterized protein n=1 Tax=Paragemmobacter straminiformis TaxID=2045119 RepID=A0A842I3V4_9RHOB|nr:hypothetical protein [Gemmobacter straminiformis]MBC2834530.1 hypothetical protein [Gemmobacter straminiformis]